MLCAQTPKSKVQTSVLCTHVSLTLTFPVYSFCALCLHTPFTLCTLYFISLYPVHTLHLLNPITYMSQITSWYIPI